MPTSPYADPPVLNYDAANWSGCRQRFVDFSVSHASNPSFVQIPGFSGMELFVESPVANTTGHTLTNHSQIKLSHQFLEYKPHAGHAMPNAHDDVRMLTFPLKSIWVESGLAPTDTNLMIGGEIDISKMPHHVKKHIDTTRRASGDDDTANVPCTVCYIELSTQSTASAPSVVDPTSPYGTNLPNLQRTGPPALAPQALSYSGTTPLLMYEPNPAPGQPSKQLIAWTEYRVTSHFDDNNEVAWLSKRVGLANHPNRALNPATTAKTPSGHVNVVVPSTVFVANNVGGALSNATKMIYETLYNCVPDAVNTVASQGDKDVKLPSPLFLSPSAIEALILDVQSINISSPSVPAMVCGAMSKTTEEINSVSKSRTLQWLHMLKQISSENYAIANSLFHLQQHSDNQARASYMGTPGAWMDPMMDVSADPLDTTVLHSVDCN